jgi:hypothetical protein
MGLDLIPFVFYRPFSFVKSKYICSNSGNACNIALVTLCRDNRCAVYVNFFMLVVRVLILSSIN